MMFKIKKNDFVTIKDQLVGFYEKKTRMLIEGPAQGPPLQLFFTPREIAPQCDQNFLKTR